MASSEPQPITLHFQNLVRIAGETIEGLVDLHVPLLHKDGIEHVRIEMQGVIKTVIIRQYGQSTIAHKQTVPVFEALSQSLWTSGSAQSGSDVLSCPFRFTLPENLPPSFCYGKYSPYATIRYSLQIVADRPGIFHRNRRIRRVFLVMPAASEDQLLTRESLRQGWSGSWKVTEMEEKMRQGIWGDYSHVHATLSLPDLASFPIATPVPYSLHIVTETKTLDRSDRPEDKRGKPLFPAPPQSSELSVVLRRKLEYIVRQSKTLHEEKRKDNFDLRKSRSLADNTESRTTKRTQPTPIQSVEPAGEVHTAIAEPEWIPQDNKDRGIWRRSVRFTSTLTFPFAPTCSTETIDWTYKLQFIIPFPGMGNDLKLEAPIDLGPSVACPPPPIGAPGSSNLTYADVLPAGSPMTDMLDLPPMYFASDNHDWDDEKDEKA